MCLGIGGVDGGEGEGPLEGWESVALEGVGALGDGEDPEHAAGEGGRGGREGGVGGFVV